MKPTVLVSQHICLLSAGVTHQCMTERGQAPSESCSMSLLPDASLKMAIIIMPEWPSLPHLREGWMLDRCFNLGPGEGQHTFPFWCGQKSPQNNATEVGRTEDSGLDVLAWDLLYSPLDFVSLEVTQLLQVSVFYVMKGPDSMGTYWELKPLLGGGPRKTPFLLKSCS